MEIQLVQALSHLLPDSPFYPTLSKLPPPDPTSPTATTIAYIQTAVYNELSILEEIVGLVEVQEISHIEKETERRRTRLGAGSPEQIRREVGREVWAQSHVWNMSASSSATADCKLAPPPIQPNHESSEFI